MKHQKRYNPNDLQIFTIIKKDIYVEPTTIYDRIFSVYGKVFKCVTQTVTLDSIDSISKKDIEECIDKVISKFKFEYKIINEKIRKPQDLAIIYNDLRRLGIISIGSGGSWKKDKPAKLTPLGQRIKICLNRLDDEKIGALLVTLCRQMQNLSNELLKNEAGYCFKDQLTKNEEELFRRANEVLGSFNPDATCSPLTSKVRVVVQNFLDLAILSVLVSGKNLLLLGSPGSGKTSYLVNFLNSLGIKYTIKTGNPEWTAFDVVGGYTLSGWRDGFLTRIFREYSDIHWLLIDEFNRANIDMCFGEYFTMLDVEYRDQAVAIGNVKSESIKVPYSFRVLGTFNSYDKSGLHKLGYALMRRFAIVNFDIFINGEKLKEKYKHKPLKFLNEQKTNCTLKEKINIKKLLDVLLKFDEEKNDYVMLDYSLRNSLEQYIRNNVNVFKVEVRNMGEVDIFSMVACLADEINKRLEQFDSCDICPVSITPGIVADIMRYFAATRVICEQLANENWCLNTTEGVQRHLDFAFSTYAVPQLSVLSDYIQLEGPNSELGYIVSDIAKMAEESGLIVTSMFLHKLSRGYAVP